LTEAASKPCSSNQTRHDTGQRTGLHDLDGMTPRPGRRVDQPTRPRPNSTPPTRWVYLHGKATRHCIVPRWPEPSSTAAAPTRCHGDEPAAATRSCSSPRSTATPAHVRRQPCAVPQRLPAIAARPAPRCRSGFTLTCSATPGDAPLPPRLPCHCWPTTRPRQHRIHQNLRYADTEMKRIAIEKADPLHNKHPNPSPSG